MNPNREYSKDEFFMLAAISEARKALEEGEVPIGAVIVAGDRIVARAHNLVETLSDATAHAEMQALTSAMHAAGGKYLPQCTLYVTVEPCAMCAGASAWGQVGRIVYGAADAKRGYSTISPAILHPKTRIEGGLLEPECGALMTDFFKTLRS
jgi:tRNA(adenine34) deaminase